MIAMKLKIHEHSRSVIYGWTFSYLLLMLITVVLTLVVYFIARNTIEAEITNSNQLLLENIRDNIDTALSEADDLSLDIFSDPEIQSISSLTPNDTTYYYKLYKAAQGLENYKFYNGPFQDLYIHLNYVGRVVRPGIVNFSRDYYHTYLETENFTFDQWQNIVSELHYGDYITLPYSTRNSEKKLECALIRTISPFSVTDVAANLVIMMDFSSILNYGMDDRNLMVLDDKNQVIAQSQTENSFDPQDLPSDLSSGETVSCRSEGQTQMVSCIASQKNEWKYIIVTPESVFWEKAWFIRNIMWGEILLCVLGMGLLSFYFIKRNYNILKEITSFVRSKIQSKTIWNGNEFIYIQQALSKSIEEKQEAVDKLDRQTLTLQTNFLISLLEGRSRSVPFDESLTSCEIQFPFSGYGAAVISIKHINEELWLSGQEKKFDVHFIAKFAVQNVAEEILSRNRKVYCVEIWDLLWFILNTNENEVDFEQALRSELTSIQDFVAQNFDIDLCMAVSALHHSPDELSNAHDEAQNALEYEQVLGRGDITFFHDIDFSYRANEGYPYDEERRLINCIRIGDTQAAQAVVEELFSRYSSSAALPEEAKSTALLLSANILHTIDLEANRKCIIPQNNDLLRQITKCKNVKELKLKISALIQNVSQSLSLVLQQENSLSTEVQSFILEHYTDPTLCISAIAHHLEKSPYYISKIFKMETGGGILDFINRIRVEKSKELLREDGMTQEQIAERTGFSNIRTFQRTFKKLEGIPPGKFKEHTNSSEIGQNPN